MLFKTLHLISQFSIGNKLIKFIVNGYLFFYLYQLKNNASQNESRKSATILKNPLTIFIPTFSDHFYLGIYTALSFYQYYTNCSFVFMVDGQLSRKQHALLRLLPFKASVSYDLPPKQKQQLKKYKHITEYQAFSWSFNKFFTPLLTKKTKVMVLDSDTLFLSRPDEIIDWAESSNKSSLYLEDYLSFCNLSYTERLSLQKKVRVKKLNSGLLCINLSEFWQVNSLSKIDYYLQKIAQISATRMVFDFFSQTELNFHLNLYEQTLFTLALNNLDLKAKKLSSKYQMLNNESPINPVFVHFTPDRRSKEYQHIFLLTKAGALFSPTSFNDFRKFFLPKSTFLSQYQKLFDTYYFKRV